MNDSISNEQLLNNVLGSNQKKKQLSDDEMGMAIMNLQAMLNIEDIDRVIELLQQNDWDESQAANAHFA
jgi:hypothetical protein